ncbi:WYL domain-containing protein [Streptomyces erythrochromogenes]|uniref:WYL domain-containing protein n=1 Tax=Streptomyces erythrochromogenes TaxID=285574 RepID=UPI0037D282D4
MKYTANETQTKTLTRLIGALDKHHPVTITYTKADSTQTIRTIEIHDIKVSNAGDILIAAMDRETGERRDFRLDRIQTYTIHRTSYLITREPATTQDAPAKRPAQGIATVTVLYPVDAPTARRIAILAHRLAA